MVDEKLIRERYPVALDREEIERAFQTLQRFGVFDLFIHANKMRVVDSFEQGTDEDLACKMRDMRLENKTLTSLNMLFATPPQRTTANA